MDGYRKSSQVVYGLQEEMSFNMKIIKQSEISCNVRILNCLRMKYRKNIDLEAGGQIC